MVELDKKLIRKLKQGDSKAFSLFGKSYNRIIFSIVRRITVKPEDSSEALQNTLINVYRKISSYRTEASFSTWIYRIATNAAVDIIRKRNQGLIKTPLARIVENDAEEQLLPEFLINNIANPEAQYLQKELREIIYKAVCDLPPIYENVFVLKYVEGLTESQICAKLNISAPALKSRLHRARSMVRENIGWYVET